MSIYNKISTSDKESIAAMNKRILARVENMRALYLSTDPMIVQTVNALNPKADETRAYFKSTTKPPTSR